MTTYSSILYGVTMPLAENLPAVRELIHPPLKGGASEEACTGIIGRIRQPLVDIAENPSAKRQWFDMRRKGHRNFLKTSRKGCDLTPDWLTRHQDIA